MSADRIPLESSGRTRDIGLRPLRDASPATVLEATILVRRRPGAQESLDKILRGEAAPLSRCQAEQALGAAPEDLQRVADFAAEYGLTVVETSAAKRSVKVSGTAAQMNAAFSVKLGYDGTAPGAVLSYQGTISIPASLDQVITGVLGLDQTPVAKT